MANYDNLRYTSGDHYVPGKPGRWEPRLTIWQVDSSIPNNLTNATIKHCWSWGFWQAPTSIRPYSPDPGNIIPDTFKHENPTGTSSTVIFKSTNPNPYPGIYNMVIGSGTHRVFGTQTYINGVEIQEQKPGLRLDPNEPTHVYGEVVDG